MSLVKLARPWQEKKPGGCLARLREYLQNKPGRARDIAEATDYTLSTVQNAIVELKQTDPELAKRLIDGRKALVKKPPKPRIPRKECVQPTADEVVKSALRRKTALEKCWKAPK